MCKGNMDLFAVLLFGVFVSCVAGVLRAGEEPVPIPGATPPLSEAQVSNSDSSSGTLTAWGNLYGKFQGELAALRQDLQAALSDAAALRTSEQRLTVLSGTSSQRIKNLESFIEQIGERMQDRDEEISHADDIIDELEKTILKQNNEILKMGIAIGILVLVVIAFIVLTVLILYGKLKIPLLKLLGGKAL
jgi:hypothetical protein